MVERVITSLTNDTVKAVRALHMRKERETTGHFLAEGLKFIGEALDQGRIPRLLLVGMEDNYGDDWHIRENDDSQYMSLLEAGLDGASLTLMERAHGTARWRSERGESKPIELTAPDRKPAGTVYAYQSEPDEWRIYDKYGGRSLGGEPGETIKDALRHIGYQLEES